MLFTPVRQIAHTTPTTGGAPWKFHRQSISICSTTRPPPKKNTVKTCEFVLSRFTAQFGKRDLASISQEEVLTFLLSLTKDNKQATKRNRYSVLASFYNFSINTGLPALTNPCNSSVIKKIFKRPQAIQLKFTGIEVSRSLKDVLTLMEKINHAGAGFPSLTEVIDTTSPGGGCCRIPATATHLLHYPKFPSILPGIFHRSSVFWQLFGISDP